MKKLKVYISLPITGRDIEKRRRLAADFAKRFDTELFELVNPFENGLDEDAPKSEHMRADIRLLTECDVAFFLDGWQSSLGCLVEYDVAVACGIRVVEQGEHPESVIDA